MKRIKLSSSLSKEKNPCVDCFPLITLCDCHPILFFVFDLTCHLPGFGIEITGNCPFSVPYFCCNRVKEHLSSPSANFIRVTFAIIMDLVHELIKDK